MDIRQLRAFITPAETKNYGIASQRLFITQPALTKQIQALEKELGVRLFVRGRGGAKLTPVAETLLPETLTLVRQLQEYRHFALHTAEAIGNKLSIGFGISFIKTVPKWISEFSHFHPDIQISLEDQPSCMQISGLRDGTLQLAFIRMPAPSPLTSHFIISDGLSLVANKNASWMSAFKKSRDYSLLTEVPILKINPRRGPGLDKQIKSFLQHNSITLNKLQQCDDIQTIMALASEDAGVAIVPESSKWFASENSELIPLYGCHTRWDTGMVWNPVFEHPTRDLFIDMVISKNI